MICFFNDSDISKSQYLGYGLQNFIFRLFVNFEHSEEKFMNDNSGNIGDDPPFFYLQNNFFTGFVLKGIFGDEKSEKNIGIDEKFIGHQE